MQRQKKKQQTNKNKTSLYDSWFLHGQKLHNYDISSFNFFPPKLFLYLFVGCCLLLLLAVICVCLFFLSCSSSRTRQELMQIEIVNIVELLWQIHWVHIGKFMRCLLAKRRNFRATSLSINLIHLITCWHSCFLSRIFISISFTLCAK